MVYNERSVGPPGEQAVIVEALARKRAALILGGVLNHQLANEMGLRLESTSIPAPLENERLADVFPPNFDTELAKQIQETSGSDLEDPSVGCYEVSPFRFGFPNLVLFNRFRLLLSETFSKKNASKISDRAAFSEPSLFLLRLLLFVFCHLENLGLTS